jgi:hypothetical protein
MNESFWAGCLDKLAVNRMTRELLEGKLNPANEAQVRGMMRSSRVMGRGMATGTENIAKKMGIKVHETGVGDVARGLATSVKGGVAGARKGVGFGRGAKFTSEPLKEHAAHFMTAAAGGGGAASGKEIHLLKGQPLISKKFGPKGMTRHDRRYLSEIIKRHEIDEIRSRSKNPMNIWHPTAKPIVGTGGRVRQIAGAHRHPQVLVRESRHATLAPAKVREAMKKMRQSTGEADLMARHGIRYGQATPGRTRAIEKKLLAAGVKPNVGSLVIDPQTIEQAKRMGEKIKPLAFKAKEAVKRVKGAKASLVARARAMLRR